MPRILLLAALLLLCSGCLFGDSDADSALGCGRVDGAPDASALPAGHRLAWAEGNRLWVLLDGCAHPQLLREHVRPIDEVRWSADGDAIAFQDGTATTVIHTDRKSSGPFVSTRFSWLDAQQLLVLAHPKPPRDGVVTSELTLVNVADGDASFLAGAISFAAHRDAVAFWQDAGACASEALPPDQLKPEGGPIERRCPRLVVRTPDEERPRLSVGIDEIVAAMPGGVPSLGLTSPGSIDWSPDGEWIVFRMCGVAASGCVDTQHMFEVHLGSGVVTYVDDTSGAVAWSPDSSRHAYVQAGGRPYDAYPRPIVVREAGTAGEGATISPPDVEDWHPAWSPDSQMIAFASFPSQRIGQCQACAPEVSSEGIWTMRADGSARTQLTSSPEWVDSTPQWSPDGEWMMFERRGPAYVENEGYPKTQLWIMRPDGADQHMVADLSGSGPSNVPLRANYGWWTPTD
jgi:dipeptidyl aminopeptidase/acylaminoacyl peptidase